MSAKKARPLPCNRGESSFSSSSADPKRRRKGEKDEDQETTPAKGAVGNGVSKDEKRSGIGQGNDDEKLCPVCETKTDDWMENPAVCAGCEKDFGCADCCFEDGSYCETCGIYKCNDCPDPVEECERCEKYYCGDCCTFRKSLDPSEEDVQICAACAKEEVSKCEVCDKEVHKMQMAMCSSCGKEDGFCSKCAAEGDEGDFCSRCDEFFCDECYMFCSECEQPVCRECGGDGQIVKGVPVCSNCRPGGGSFCRGCGEKITSSERCIDCGALKCYCGSNCDCQSSSQEEEDEAGSSEEEPSDEGEEEDDDVDGGDDGDVKKDEVGEEDSDEDEDEDEDGEEDSDGDEGEDGEDNGVGDEDENEAGEEDGDVEKDEDEDDEDDIDEFDDEDMGDY